MGEIDHDLGAADASGDIVGPRHVALDQRHRLALEYLRQAAHAARHHAYRVTGGDKLFDCRFTNETCAAKDGDVERWNRVAALDQIGWPRRGLVRNACYARDVKTEFDEMRPERAV